MSDPYTDKRGKGLTHAEKRRIMKAMHRAKRSPLERGEKIFFIVCVLISVCALVYKFIIK